MVAMGIWHPRPMPDGGLSCSCIRKRTPVLTLSVNSLDQAVEAAEPATPSRHTLTYFENHDGPSMTDPGHLEFRSVCYSNSWELIR